MHLDPELVNTHLLSAIQIAVPDPIVMNQIAAAALGVSEVAAFKKTSGQIPLEPDEFLALTGAFNISLDRFIHGSTTAFAADLDSDATPFGEPQAYLGRILKKLEASVQLPDLYAHHASTAIQVFHYLPFQALTSFKLFVLWQHSWNLPLRGPDLHPETILADARVEALRQQIIQVNSRINGVEFWSLSMLQDTMNQIEYFAFKQPGNLDYYLLLCDELKQLLALHQNMAAAGRRYDVSGKAPDDTAGSYRLYFNEIVHTGNIYLLESKVGRMVITIYNNPNFFTSSDLAFCDYTADWFDRLSKNAQLLSGQAEKMRNIFFDKLRHQVDTLIEKISRLRPRGN
jgi:hypothetical protein